MTASATARIREKVRRIEHTPAIPAVFLPLLELLNVPPEKTNLDEVVKLVSYDNTIAAQCLRMASSPLFGLAKAPESIRGAVISLGLRRVETILLTCCLGQAFPTKNWVLDPIVYWRHSLGCAMVCRKFAEKLSHADGDKAYMAGLMHDIGILVNCLAFSSEFAQSVNRGVSEQIPLDEAELSVMGFTHCETGRALAEKWHLSEDIVEVIAHHHDVEQSETARPLVALVHLSDLLCRVRGMGYGYYESRRVDLAGDPAWSILLQEHRELEGMDLVRFTFELDEAVSEIFELVSMIIGSGSIGR
jgi:putative nucleotidyltransferase with HDIG domain